MAFCIRPELADVLKQAAKAGEISIEKLYTMSSQERRELFGKYVDSQSAQGVNAGFEKAMASEQQKSIASWVQKTFSSGEKQKSGYKDIVTKINDLNQQGLLTPENEKAFLQDLVTEKLGGTVSVEEAKTIADHASQLEKLSKDVSPVNTKTVEYYQAKRTLENYIQSLTPASTLRVFTSTIGRGAMLLSVKSPLLNVVSNSVQGFLATAERRIANRRFNGFNADFANQFRKYAGEVYSKTGYDLSRFQAFEGGIKTLGEDYTHSQGPGLVRKLGRAYEDIAFKLLQGAPDAAFARFHFADSANLSSSLVALKEGLKGTEAKTRSLEILKDAFSETPQTKEGQMVKAQAEADALYATYTNKSLASQTGLALRKVANVATGDLRFGDINDPFVKTPANVLSAGLDYSGATLTAKMALGIGKSLNDVVHLKSFDKENFANVNQYFVKAGLGLTFAYVISSLIKPQDFLGQWPTNPAEQQLISLRNGATNAVKVGDKWVSLDYLGPLGAPLLGFLYAKKYGDANPLDKAYRFGEGVKASLQNFPGLAMVSQAYSYIQKLPDKNAGVSKATVDAGKAALGMVTSRIIPGIVTDLAKMTDPYVRSTDKNSIFSTLQSQIPGLREGLPISKTVFGDQQKTESWVSTLLFGARVKSNQDSTLLNELVTLDQQGSLPSLTDVSKSSQRAKDLKNQIGEEKFTQAMEYFGKNLKENFLDTIDSADYSDATPKEKQTLLNKTKETTFTDMLDEYNYEKPEKP